MSDSRADITIIASNGSNTGSVGPFTIRVSPVDAGRRQCAADHQRHSRRERERRPELYVRAPGERCGRRAADLRDFQRPVWAMFDTATGRLSGTPNGAQVGNYTNIDISVSDGKHERRAADVFDRGDPEQPRCTQSSAAHRRPRSSPVSRTVSNRAPPIRPPRR